MELVQQSWSAYWSFLLRILDGIGVPADYQILGAVVITFVLVILILKILSSIFGGSSHHYISSGFSDHGRNAMENAQRAHQNAARAHQNAVRTHQNMTHRH